MRRDEIGAFHRLKRFLKKSPRIIREKSTTGSPSPRFGSISPTKKISREPCPFCKVCRWAPKSANQREDFCRACHHCHVFARGLSMVRFAWGLQVGVWPDNLPGCERKPERAWGSHSRTTKNPRRIAI